MLKFEDRIIALRDQEIQELSNQNIDLIEAGHKLLDELAAAHAENRALKEQLESYEQQNHFDDRLLDELADAHADIRDLKDKVSKHEWLCGHAAGLADSLAEARETIARLNAREVQP